MHHLSLWFVVMLIQPRYTQFGHPHMGALLERTRGPPHELTSAGQALASGPAGYASIEYAPRNTSRPDVEGVVHDLSREEFKRLQQTEGGYDVRDVFVSTAPGETTVAQAFVTNWSVRLFKETLPTKTYIGKLRTGASEFGLSAEYQVCPHSPAAATCTDNQRHILGYGASAYSSSLSREGRA